MRKILTTLLFLVSLPGFISAQETFKIKGNVTDAKTGEPLIGSSVILKPSNLGAATDLEGNYSFDVPTSLAKGQQAELVASFINYKKKSVTVTLNGSNITQNFALDEDVFQSEEIVVTGIASKTSKAVAEVAVGRVSAPELQATNTYSGLSQLVQGKVAGVQMTTSSGNIGSGWRFFMRGGGGLNGDEQPTIYIDGVRLDNAQVIGYGVGGQGISTLANLNPNDIDKIEFLKGPAAAAMYGTNGSNGVVLITTRSGKISAAAGMGLSVDYKFNYGYNQQYYKYKKEDFLSADAANRQFSNGPLREHTLSASGGSQTLRYFASFEQRTEAGTLPTTSGDRNSVRLNITSLLANNLSIKITGNYVNNKILRPNNDNTIFGFLGNTLLSPISFGWVAENDLRTSRDQSTINQFIGSGNVNWKPIENLEINGTIGLDNNDFRQEQLYPYGRNFGGLIQKGQKSLYNRNNRQFTYDFNANYSYTLFEFLNVRSYVGGQFFNIFNRTNFVQGQEFNTDLITNLGSAGKITNYGEGYGNTKNGGLYTEHSFNYQEQYFLTLGIRRDYASSIGQEAPAITYPKASFAIRLDKYNSLPEFINLFKLRAAYGESGILPLNTDPISLLWGAQTGGYGAGAVLSNIGNAAIKPERVKEFEIGFESEFMKNLSIDFTYYVQNAVNSIVGKQNAPSTGLTASDQPFNIGSSKNWGLESLIQYSPLRSSDYNLQLSMIWNYQKNQVQSLGGAQPIFSQNNVIKEGFAKYQFYTYTSVGPKFDANGKYTSSIRSDDRVDLGNPIPNWTGSFTVNFRFLKNFSLYAFAEWALNNKIFNFTKLFASRFGNNSTYNRYRALLGLPEAAPGVAPKDVTPLTPGTAEYIDAANKYAKLDYAYQGNYIEAADYLIIREVSLSYDFTDFVKDFGMYTYMKYLTVGVSVRNLARFTKYTGADVEFNYTGSRSIIRGADFLTLQNPRTVNFWLRIGI